MRIGIFDSGIGGLTILKELLKEKPNNHYIYYGDNINLPYGDKNREELTKILDRIIKYFIGLNVDLIIIACGTMSSILDKSKYNIKIIDIIEPIVNYLSTLNIDKVLLLGTNRTIEEGTFKRSLEQLNIKVYDKACPKFALILESKLDEDINLVIDEYLSEFKGIDFDKIILGCTHFSLIEDKIKCYLSNTSVLIIGRLISEYVEEGNISNVEIYFGSINKDTKNRVFRMFNLDVKQLNI